MTGELLVLDPDATAEATVDPAVLLRREKVARGQRWRARARLIAIAALAVVTVLALIAWFSPLFRVGTVRVKGLDAERRAAVQKIGNGQKGRSMWMVDTGTIARRVDAVAGVSDVHVTTKWPSTVVISARGLQPVAYAATADGQVALVDAEGRVVQLATEVPGDLVRLDGATLDAAVGSKAPQEFRDALAVAGAMSKRLTSHVVSVRTDQSSGVTLVLDGSGEVVIGDAEHLPTKLRSVETMLSGRVVLACLERIDVRVPSAPTVTRNRKCTGNG